MADAFHGDVKARLSCSSDGARHNGDRDSVSARATDLPPLLRSVSPFSASSNATLSYHCVSTYQNVCQEVVGRTNQHGPNVDPSLLEFALVSNNNEIENDLNRCPAGTDMQRRALSASRIVPQTLHAIFSRPSKAILAVSPLSISPNPVFPRCCPRLRCHLFDIVCHSKAGDKYSHLRNRTASATQATRVDAVRKMNEMDFQQEEENTKPTRQQLAEVLRLAVVAHAGTVVAASSTQNTTRSSCMEEPKDKEAAIQLDNTAHYLERVLSQLCPQSLAFPVSLGLTMTSSLVTVGKLSCDGPSSLTSNLPIDLHWSWVASPGLQKSGIRTSADASHVHLNSTLTTQNQRGYTALWRYWTSVLTAGGNEEDVNIDDTKGLAKGASLKDGRSDGYTSCSDASSLYRRLQLYARRAKRAFFAVQRDRENNAAQMACALLAVWVDAQAQALDWMSPLTPLSSHDPHTFARCLHLWFTFVGLATNSSAVVTEVQASVKAALLGYFDSEVFEVLHSVVDAPVHSPIQAQLRCLCEWLTQQVLNFTLRWMPSALCVKVTTLGESEAAEVVAAAAVSGASSHVRETHLLFRRSEEASYNVSPQVAQHHDPWFLNEAVTGTCSGLDLRIAHRAQLTHLFNQLLQCVADVPRNTQTSFTSHAQDRRRPSCVPVLTYGLFAHPAQHGVVVCRLHVNVTPASLMTSRAPPDSCSNTLVQRSPVAALLQWYAIDFEDAFRQAYRTWSLTQRCASKAATATDHLPDNAPRRRSSNARYFVGAATIDPAIESSDLVAVSTVVGKPSPAACLSSELGLLGRCLLLGLWMRLRLIDLDLVEQCDDGSTSKDCSDTGYGDRKKPADAAATSGQVGGTCGTLYYSSRRNMLFARDWRTVRQLCNVLEGATAALPEESSVIERRVTTTTWAATAVLQAFLRAYEARQHAAATQLRRRLQAEAREQQQQLAARRLRAAAVVQAWWRSQLCKRRRRQLRDEEVQCTVDAQQPSVYLPDGASTPAEEFGLIRVVTDADVGEYDVKEEEEEDCVLLHWSAVEEAASVASIDSVLSALATSNDGHHTKRIDANIAAPVQATSATTPHSTEVMQQERSFQTPVRKLTVNASFAVTTERRENELAAGPLPASMQNSSRADTPVSAPAESGVVCKQKFSAALCVTPPLSLGQRHLLQLESDERALLWHTALSELLWLTCLLECVGRRVWEADEAAAWQCLLRREEMEEQRCAAQLYHASQAARTKGRRSLSRTEREEVSLHRDERVPVTALLVPLPSSPPTSASSSLASSPRPSTPPSATASHGDKQAAAFNELCNEENAARDVLQRVEEGIRSHTHADFMRRCAQIGLAAHERQQRRFIAEQWALEQAELQARWTTAVLPECVLREWLQEAFAEERPLLPLQNLTSSCPESTRKGCARRPQRSSSPTTTPAPAASSPAMLTSLSPLRITSSRTRQSMKHTIVEDADAQRAFLLQEEREEVIRVEKSEVKYQYRSGRVIASRRSASQSGNSNGNSTDDRAIGDQHSRLASSSPSPTNGQLPPTRSPSRTRIPMSSLSSPGEENRNPKKVAVAHASELEKSGSEVQRSAVTRSPGRSKSSSSSSRASTSPHPRLAQPTAHPAQLTTTATKAALQTRRGSVPVVAVSLRTDSDEEAPTVKEFSLFPERRINEMASTKRKTSTIAPTSASTGGRTIYEVSDETCMMESTPDRGSETPTASSPSPLTASRGGWYVSLNGASVNHDNLKTTHSPPSTTAFDPPPPHFAEPLFGSGRTAARSRGTSSDQNTVAQPPAVAATAATTKEVHQNQERRRALFLTSQLHREDDAGDSEDVASAVAAAIALARDSTDAEQRDRASARRTFARAPLPTTSQQSPPAKAESILGAVDDVVLTNDKSTQPPLLKPPRKRYVTWADDVQEFRKGV